MEYFVKILCVIVLTTILSLTTCQNVENLPSQTKHEHSAPANTGSERQNNREKLDKPKKTWPNHFYNVITFLLFLHLMLIIVTDFC